MMGLMNVYCKLYKENDKPLPTINRSYILLEPVQEWCGDRNKGLAAYIDNELEPYVKSIEYKCVGANIKFTTWFNDGYDEYNEIEYEGQKCTLFQAVCRYIQCQVCDGWGEGGVFLHDVTKGKAIWANPSYHLYQYDPVATEKNRQRIMKRYGYDFVSDEEALGLKKIDIKVK